MVASVASVEAHATPRVRWSYLWSRRSDMTFNFVPFWFGLVLVALLYAARNLAAPSNPVYDFTFAGVHVHLATWVMYLYGPLVDAPHLWATIARTYTDKKEWAERRTLFIASLVALLIGPVVILCPYLLHAAGVIPAGHDNAGWLLWSHFFTFYALFHINKQHWGFVALYRRKNQDTNEQRVDQLFFYTAIWAPFVAMVTAPWYIDYDGKPFAFTHAGIGSHLYGASHVVFFAATVAYVVYQIDQYRKGVTRNGPKLAYLATIIPLNYLAFSIHPFIAAFWIVTTGLGHCAQYHRVVWAYGQSQYVAKKNAEESLPRKIFASLPLYILLGVLFGILTLQGFGGGRVKTMIAGGVGHAVFAPLFSFLSEHEYVELALKVVAAFVSGVRLHHFYVDSKIWRVSKSAALAKNLNVSANPA